MSTHVRYSGHRASSCISCPDGKLSAAGSTSEDDCYYGNLLFDQILRKLNPIEMFSLG